VGAELFRAEQRLAGMLASVLVQQEHSRMLSCRMNNEVNLISKPKLQVQFC
jgi:hypothetical protein